MFRHLRSKIILAFCVLMIVGSALTTSVVKRNLTRAISEAVDRNALTLASTLSIQLTEPLAYADWFQLKKLLLNAQEISSDTLYLFVVSPDGRILEHSFPSDRFPHDLVNLASGSEPRTLQAEEEKVRHLSVPIAEGTLGVLHIGTSISWEEQAILEAVRNVVMMTGVAMGVGVLGILLLANLITRPILELTEAARSFESGEEFSAAKVRGRDEVADLAIAFNRLVAQIREQILESNELRAYVENIINHLASSVIVVEESGQVEYANRTANELHGELVGRFCEDALKERGPEFMTSVRHVLETDMIESRMTTEESGRTYELTYIPMLGGDGRRLVVESGLDLTEQREMAERLHRAERLAVAGEVAAGVVHTINNPLDGVRRAIQLAPKSLDDTARVKKLLALAEEGCDRIASVTHTLLGFARLDAKAERIPVSLETVAHEAIELVHLKALSREVRIRLECGPALPDVAVDVHGIKEVFINLLMNGVDAYPDGGGEIVVRIEEIENDWIEVSVIDQGDGILPEVAERIFEPFVSSKDVGHGTGLGLSVVRRIVVAHGGEVTAEPTAGKGATFRVRIPMSTRENME